jgi:hypothetical protein
MKFNVQFNGIPEYKFDLINIKNKKKLDVVIQLQATPPVFFMLVFM